MKRKKLIQSLLGWHKESGIEHSWKSELAYPAWVAETVLQQTRVAQGTSYIHRFLERFPNVHILAKSSINDVLRVWEGLGYYRRAHHMHQAAKIIDKRGCWPSTKEEWKKLPGIGPYTAGALAAFVNKENCPAIDGNVIRIFARWYDIEMDLYSAHGQQSLEALVQEHLELCQAHIYNQVLMDFGSHVCTPKSPSCHLCVAQKYCQSYRNQTVDNRPQKRARKEKKSRFFLLYWCEDDDLQLDMVKRENKDIWQGLWTLPFQEVMRNEWENRVANNDMLNHRQTLSHQYIHTALIFKSHGGACPLSTKRLPVKMAEKLPMDKSSRHYFNLLANVAK